MIIPKPKYKIGDKLWTWWLNGVVDAFVYDIEFIYNYEDKTKKVVYYCSIDNGKIHIDICEGLLYTNKKEAEKEIPKGFIE